MIKAASKLSCLIFLIASALASNAPNVFGDPATPVATATEEAVRREADTMMLRKKLALAQSARQQRDLVGALRLYDDCYVLAQKIGGGVESETQQAVIGVAAVSLDLAHQAQKRNDYKTAREYVVHILVIDPKNQVALDFKRDNERLLAAQAGTIPSEAVMAQIPAFRTNEIRVATMVQDGKLLYEAGKLNEAEAKLTLAYQEDPSNVAAYQYLQMIKDKRMADANRRAELGANQATIQVEKEWDVAERGVRFDPKPNAWGRSDQSHLSKGRQAILSKLDRIRLDSVKYDGLPLVEVINNLNEQAKLRDPDRVGINFYIDRETASPVSAGPTAIDPQTLLPVAPQQTEAADVDSVTVKVNPALTDVRLGDVLDAITKTADKPIKFSVLDYAIVFSLRGQETVPLETRKFHVDPNTFRQGLESVTGIEIGNITTSSGSGGGGGGGGGGGSSGGGSGQSFTVLPSVSVTSGG